MTPPKEHKMFPVTSPKEVKVYDKKKQTKNWIKETQWTTGIKKCKWMKSEEKYTNEKIV